MRTSLALLAVLTVAAACVAPPDVPPSPRKTTWTLPIRGRLDCTNRIVITRDDAQWHFTAGAPPGEVEFGAVAWLPEEQPVLANSGATRFLPDDVRLDNARLRVLAGRNLVGLEATAEAVTVFVTDTPVGADDYALDIDFDRGEATAELHVRARIDGGDTLRIEPEFLTWQHRHWDAPSDVAVDAEAWDVAAQPERRHFMPAGVDLRTARIVERRGRDTVCLRIEAGHVDVLFADDPPGAGEYEVTIRFGR